MNFNITQLLDPFILLWMVIFLLLEIAVILSWHKKIYLNFGLKNYQSIQRIHINETPRLAGLVLIISLIGFVYCSDMNEGSSLLSLLLTCLIPLIIVGLKEDLYQNVSPTIRFFSLIFVSWLFMTNYLGPLPDLRDVSLLTTFIAYKGGLSVFYITSIISIANGMNFIDGVNGLCGAVTLTILTALIFLCYKTNDSIMLWITAHIFLLLVPFMLLNYPYGLIFLGDLGAYSLGFIVSIFTIVFFGRHPEISPWLAVLILIYPASEVIFSLIRRLINRASLTTPDKLHLHIEIYNFLTTVFINRKIANSIVTPILSLLWMFPLFVINWIYDKPFFIFVAIIVFIILYSLFYFIFFKIKKNIQNK